MPVRSHRHLILLGPQTGNWGNLDAVLREADIAGPLALISAGWEESESDDDDLRGHLTGDVINLRLFHRAEQLFENDPEMFELLRQRQDRLRELRDVYRRRLDDSLRSARWILEKFQSQPWIEPECQSAIGAVRQLDNEYALRTQQICDEYDQLMNIARRPLVVRHRQELAEKLKGARALLIAGGHVGVLLNRLKIFARPESVPELPVVAWSGGVMALSRRIVLFHDRPPQGPGNAEVLRPGLECFNHLVPLPHARDRLDLDDPIRVALFARRFHPAACLIMEAETVMSCQNGSWRTSGPAIQLHHDGQLREFAA